MWRDPSLVPRPLPHPVFSKRYARKGLATLDTFLKWVYPEDDFSISLDRIEARLGLLDAEKCWLPPGYSIFSACIPVRSHFNRYGERADRSVD